MVFERTRLPKRSWRHFRIDFGLFLVALGAPGHLLGPPGDDPGGPLGRPVAGPEGGVTNCGGGAGGAGDPPEVSQGRFSSSLGGFWSNFPKILD